MRERGNPRSRVCTLETGIEALSERRGAFSPGTEWRR